MNELVDDPETVAAFFESAVPELPPPVAILREPDGPRGVARFTVRTRGGAYRMKVGTDDDAADAAERGAIALASLSAHGLSCPRSLAIHFGLSGSRSRDLERDAVLARERDAVAEALVDGSLAEGRAGRSPGAAGSPDPTMAGAADGFGRALPRAQRLTVTVETRLGTTDASVAWSVLGEPGRRALLTDAVEGLRCLHAMPEDVLPDGSVGSWRERVRRCADRHLVRLSERGGIDASLVGEVRTSVRRGLDLLPPDVALAPCHGSPGLREIAVERRAFAGWRDFEALRLADPWLDVAHLAFAVEGPESTDRAKSMVAAYRGDRSVAPGTAERIAFYVQLIAVAGVAGLDATDDDDVGASLALEAVLGWECRDALARTV